MQHLLRAPEDITDRLLNVFHDFTSNNYTFHEDYVTQDEIMKNENYYLTRNKAFERAERYNTTNEEIVRESQIYDLCTGVIVNSSIAVSCGPYFDQDIMHAINICYQGIF